MAQTGQWRRGVVKEVISGDTLVVMGQPRGGPPPEQRITLASLIAPRMGRRDGTTQEEPFAWQAREFLRKKAIGQPCVFRVEYDIPGREFGSVFMGTANENLGLVVVAAGWAKVRPAGASQDKQSPYYDELAAAQQVAEEQKLGVWTEDPTAKAESVRTSAGQGVKGEALLAKVGKGTPLPALVEQVITGSILRVTLLPDYSSATVLVCGVQCGSVGRRAQPATEDAPAVEGSSPAPFALQAKHFTETKVLNREVRVVLQGLDSTRDKDKDSDTLVASVLFSEGPEAKDLGEALLQQGLAKTAEWGLTTMIQGSSRLRELEHVARMQRLGRWRDEKPRDTSTQLRDKFVGTVAEVVSGDCLMIRDHASGVERRVHLSSTRAPRIGRREEKPEAYALEAKEFLRQRLIGQEVSVSMEYTRKVQAAQGSEAPKPEASANNDRILEFGTVTITETDKAGQSRVNNVAELLLVRGLANVAHHKAEDERSAHYEALLEAEQVAARGKKGVHRASASATDKEKKAEDDNRPRQHINDVSMPGSATRAKQYLPSFQRGRQKGIVEYVLSGHRLKIYVPKEGVTIVFSPSGVRCPQRAMPASARGPATASEPFADEAVSFTRQRVLQREVELEIEAMDRGGTFLGSLRCGSGPGALALGPALLEAGLAKLHPSFDASRVAGGPELAAAEAAARAARLKVWQDYVEPPASQANGGHDEHANGGAAGQDETVQVRVTEVRSADEFYVQMVDEPRVAWLEEQLAALGLEEGQAPRLAVGAPCLARFTLDNQWYRAVVEAAHLADPVKPEYDVLFMDFGNRERVAGRRLAPMAPSLAAVPPQAHAATLAYLKVPSLEDEYGQEAAHLLSEFAGGGVPLTAIIKQRERAAGRGREAAASVGRLHLLLCKHQHTVTLESVNARLLLAGLARVQKPHGKAMAGDTDVVAELEACEEKARSRRTGMFVYGDPGEEEDEAPSRPRAWGRR